MRLATKIPCCVLVASLDAVRIDRRLPKMARSDPRCLFQPTLSFYGPFLPSRQQRQTPDPILSRLQKVYRCSNWTAQFSANKEDCYFTYLMVQTIALGIMSSFHAHIPLNIAKSTTIPRVKFTLSANSSLSNSF